MADPRTDGDVNTGYQILDAERIPPLIAELDRVRTLLGGLPEDWRVREWSGSASLFRKG